MSKYETAAYKALEKDGKFEIRSYEVKKMAKQLRISECLTAFDWHDIIHPMFRLRSDEMKY